VSEFSTPIFDNKTKQPLYQLPTNQAILWEAKKVLAHCSNHHVLTIDQRTTDLLV
jgi:hypothetical protein